MATESHNSSMYRIVTNGLWLILHFCIAAIGVPIAAAVLAYSVLLPLHQFFPSVGSRTVHWILTETPYFPLQIFVGLLWGFQLSRRYRHVAMFWTWSIPATAMVLLVLFTPLRPVVVSGIEVTGFSRFFGSSCLPQNHCFEQVAITLPFYSASAYSLGAFFARMTTSKAEGALLREVHL